MNEEPLVSIVLPTYNREDYIRRSVLSVLSQTYEKYELLVIDDGSTDDTGNIVRSIDDNRIEILRHKDNKGANVARNTGITHSEGDLIAFQDSDDVWLPSKLSSQVREINRSSDDVGVIYTGTTVVRDDEVEYFPDDFYAGNIQRELIRGNFIPTQVSLARRECFEEHGLFDPVLNRLQDWELWLRFASSFEFSYIDKPLTQTYMNVDELSIGADTEARIKSIEHILQKHQSLFSKYPDSYSQHLLTVGDYRIRSGNIKEGRRYLYKAFALNPRLQVMVPLMSSYFGEGIYKGLRRAFNRVK